MSDYPKKIHINEEGPREGFQIESASIPTRDKVELINALSETGVKHIQVVSFVNPKAVPGMADAEQVVEAIELKSGISYTGLWFNQQGYKRALNAGRLTMEGALTLSASDSFLARNQKRTADEQYAIQHQLVKMYQLDGVPILRGFVSAAFGCNFEGDISIDQVVRQVGKLRQVACEHNTSLPRIGLGDTMGWATPEAIRRVVGAVRDCYPNQLLSLHLHDTRGMGIANAYAGLQMGVDSFDSCVGGLGGCPFAGSRGAAGNVCTEDLVFMCDEMGIETGIALDKMIECADMAERIVGHALPGAVKVGGHLRRFKQ
jgi:hydroxymethylglutaryl-CoA lyase